ncbi:MAG: site-2 protease family protein [Candidatus Aenigmarchaeota archaeon]|nr:site-2 protease family protein [Candidatus Aenigmarchaeota archaeon]
MDWYLTSVIVFTVLLAIWVYRDRDKFKRESIFLLRRTKRGRKLLIRIGTCCPRFWKAVGFVSVVTGFVVSVYGLKMLVDNVLKSISTGATAPSLALLLPSPTAEPIFGYGYFAVPFWYWIICIALLALVHEGFHGIFTAREKTRIKSLGFGILAVIPLAFVEPDEKQLEKKGVWPQLRVFSAGSFANFLLAILSVVLFLWLMNSAYVASGVDFKTYPFEQVPVSSITAIGTSSVNGSADNIISVLQDYGENETMEVTAGNSTYYIKRKYLEQQLSDGSQVLTLFTDYPSAKAGLEGTITSVNTEPIKDQNDLSFALENAGSGTEINITVKNGDSYDTYTLVTVDAPEPDGFSPDTYIVIFTLLEHVVPGSIDTYYSIGEWWGGLVGMKTESTWNYINYRMSAWNWVADNYPLISERARSNKMKWEGMLSGRTKPGFIGILGVTPHYELSDSLAPCKGAIDFLQGLLVFMFMINLGVGIVNLLPVKPLDGGKMWDVVLTRYAPKHAKRVMRVFGYLILALLLANFLPIGALF